MRLSASGPPRTSKQAGELGLLFVLLLLGHLSFMAFPSLTMGQEMLGQGDSQFATGASHALVTPPPSGCPAGSGDCMLAWSQAPDGTASVGSIAHLAIGRV